MLMRLFLAFCVLISSSVAAQTEFTVLVWADECNGSGAIDTEKWHHQTLLPNGDSWFNGEIQHYTDREENAKQANGDMIITASKETYTDQGVTKQYTSARLNSKFAFTYGRVEIRAKLPQGVGTWPALWMLGKNITEPGGYWEPQFGNVGWPACGEIDIMEHWGNNPHYVQSALHTPSSFGGTVNHGGTQMTDVFDTYHVYAVDWNEERMEFSVDGDVYYTYNPAVKDAQTWPFDQDQYLLLNIAIQPSIDPAFTSSEMVIDYVRVYQAPAPTGQITVDEVPSFSVYPNPGNGNVSVMLDDAYIGGSLELLDLEGRSIAKDSIDGTRMSLDATHAAKGIYLVKAQAPSGMVNVRRVVVE